MSKCRHNDKRNLNNEKNDLDNNLFADDDNRRSSREYH